MFTACANSPLLATSKYPYPPNSGKPTFGGRVTTHRTSRHGTAPAYSARRRAIEWDRALDCDPASVSQKYGVRTSSSKPARSALQQRRRDTDTGQPDHNRRLVKVSMRATFSKTLPVPLHIIPCPRPRALAGRLSQTSEPRAQTCKAASKPPVPVAVISCPVILLVTRPASHLRRIFGCGPQK